MRSNIIGAEGATSVRSSTGWLNEVSCLERREEGTLPFRATGFRVRQTLVR